MTTLFDASTILRFSPNTYERPWWPKPDCFYFYKKSDYEGDKDPWWWKNEALNKIVRFYHSVIDYIRIDIFKNWLFRRFNWYDRNCSPSFAEAFYRLYHNMMVFFTPWYKLRRRFIIAWYNENGSKLLDDGFDFGYIRTRDNPEITYYELKFTGFRYKLIKTIIRDKNGSAVSGFLTGICIAFSNKSDEEKRAEAETYTEEKSIVCTGWVFNIRQAVNELNKIAELTPELHWFNLNNVEV